MLLRVDMQAGEVRCLYTDDLSLDSLGTLHVSRASHVEYNDAAQSWEVLSPDSKDLLSGGFRTRKEALAWEVRWAESKLRNS